MSAATSFDIVILGAGPVGQTCALLLARHWPQPQRIALVDAKSAEQSAQDPRTLALSHGSRQILERIAAWPNDAVTPIETIHVSHRGHFGRTVIRHSELEVPALGYVTSYGALMRRLQNALAGSGVTVLRPVKALSCQTRDNGVAIATESVELSAGLAIHAEGGLFGQQAKADRQRDYDQQAIVCFVTCSRLQPHTAFERFTAAGPLALLPHQLDGRAGYALVWCCRPPRAQELLAFPEAEFLAALQTQFGERAGRFLSAGPRHTFPLGLNQYDTLAAGHSVRIGNAAQTLHPVAGQGLNLGLRDAMTLVSCLQTTRTAGGGLAITAGLEQYQSLRKADRTVTAASTNFLASLFADYGTLASPLASAGLALLDLSTTIKKPLARQMMFGQR